MRLRGEARRRNTRTTVTSFELEPQPADSKSSAASKSAAPAPREKNSPEATLAKDFRGEPVPQDTNDEPASVLLERISAAYSSSLTTSRGRNRIEKGGVS